MMKTFVVGALELPRCGDLIKTYGVDTDFNEHPQHRFYGPQLSFNYHQISPNTHLN